MRHRESRTTVSRDKTTCDNFCEERLDGCVAPRLPAAHRVIPLDVDSGPGEQPLWFHLR